MRPMKTILLCTLLTAVMSAAVAAPAPPPAAKSVSASVPTLGVGKTASSAKLSKAAKEVVGVWVSTERTAVVAPGTMTLTAEGHATLAPDGFEPLKGTYVAKGQFLDITMDRGRASLIYSIEKNKMSVQYENGAMQTFTKQTSSVTNKSKVKK